MEEERGEREKQDMASSLCPESLMLGFAWGPWRCKLGEMTRVLTHRVHGRLFNVSHIFSYILSISIKLETKTERKAEPHGTVIQK